MANTLIEEVAAGRTPGVVPLTAEQYHGMLRGGILREGDPIELIEGVFVPKDRAARGGDPMTHGDQHAHVVERLHRLLASLPETYRVRCQVPLSLTAGSEPEPDLSVAVLSASERGRHPRPEEVVLACEVSDSSLAYDRGTKLRLYATAGIGSCWIVNIPDRQLEVYEDPLPTEGSYGRRTDLRPGHTARVPLAGQAFDVSVASVLPPAE